MTAMGVKFDGSVPDLKSEAGQYWINWVQTLAREGLASKEAIAWNDDNMRGGFIGSNIGMMLDSAPTAGATMPHSWQPLHSTFGQLNMSQEHLERIRRGRHGSWPSADAGVRLAVAVQLAAGTTGARRHNFPQDGQEGPPAIVRL